ncbi:MAG: hypothetical protein DRN08_06495 [Thermoplasmata archaeon]|nr:MAG: hypothetical protein DRN08_06495 [Thermoplasmata archaeon]
MVTIGIIGCGKIAEKHSLAYKKIPEVEVFVYDKDKSKAAKVARDMALEYVEDPSVFFSSKNVNAIDICVPTAYHIEYILRGIEAGKHIFCEKPLCRNTEEVREIKKRLKGRKLTVMVGYLYRYHPAFQLIKEVLVENIIGDIHFGIFRLGGRGSHAVWKHRKNGGGVILEMMVHKLDLVLWYFDKIDTCRFLSHKTVMKYRCIGNRNVRVDAEDLAVLELKSKNALIICESDLLTPSYMDYIELHGQRGSIFSSILDFMPTVVFCKETRGIFNRGNNIYHFPKVDLFVAELRDFVKNIQEGKCITGSLEDSIKIFNILEKVKAGRGSRYI